MRKYLFIPILALLPYSALAQNKISGYVVDQSTGEPIEGVTVFVHDEYNLVIEPHIRTLTDEKGYYEFADLEVKRYNVNFFNFYELAGDTFALILQPGIITLKPELVGEEGFTLDISMSKRFLFHLIDSQEGRRRIEFMNDKQKRREHLMRWNFLKPQVFVNHHPNFYTLNNHYYRKKNWN